MKKKFLGIICFIYCFIILYVIFTNHLDNYIAPNMQIYIKISIMPLLVIGLAIIFNNKINYNFKINDLFLLIPLFLVFLAGDGNLTHTIAKVKRTERVNDSETEIYEIDYDIVKSNKDIEIKEFDFDIEDPVYSYLADYLTYMKGAYKYVGKTVRLKGFAVDYSDYLTNDYFALGKYSITCCAADAEFSGMIVKYPNNKIKYGKWYQVEGILELGKDSEGYTVMTINPVSVKEIEKGNEKEYVYSCESYGNDSCEKLLEYDLNY